MKCPKCQAENPEEAEFCSLCYARFEVRLRSSDVDEAANRMREKHRGSKLCCPSCGSLSPLDTQFCLRCGFVFEDLEALMVSEEEIVKLEGEAQALKDKETVSLEIEVITVTAESDGAAVMRNLSDYLGRGLKPRINASGRNAVTYAMKIVALLGEDMRAGGSDLRLRAKLISEGSITHLEDVDLEIILESI
jgi:ribosomal protein L40E/stage V sporulation protein SpoVS